MIILCEVHPGPRRPHPSPPTFKWWFHKRHFQWRFDSSGVSGSTNNRKMNTKLFKYQLSVSSTSAPNISYAIGNLAANVLLKWHIYLCPSSILLTTVHFRIGMYWNTNILKKTTTLLNLQNMFRQKLLSSSIPLGIGSFTPNKLPILKEEKTNLMSKSSLNQQLHHVNLKLSL